MKTTPDRVSLAVVLALMAGTVQAAQTSSQDQVDRLLNTAPVVEEEPARQADVAEQDPAELRITQALNDEIASRNDLAASQERADQAAFEQARAKHEAVVAQATADRLAYEEDVRQADEAQRRWEAERARWEADVRACEAGDRARCGSPQRPL